MAISANTVVKARIRRDVSAIRRNVLIAAGFFPYRVQQILQQLATASYSLGPLRVE